MIKLIMSDKDIKAELMYIIRKNDLNSNDYDMDAMSKGLSDYIENEIGASIDAIKQDFIDWGHYQDYEKVK